MAKITVIIVTWNAEHFIKECLDSVFAQQGQTLEIFVVDNGSTDKTVPIVEGYTSGIHLIRNTENKGFCYANNQALIQSTGEFVLTLNSDIILTPNYLSVLTDYLKTHPRVGMLQGKCLRMDKTTIDCLGLHLSAGMRFYNIGEGRPDASEGDREKLIFGPCAAAALYRRKLLDDIRCGDEFFDSRFFFLIEDFDLAWRARKKGWEAVCAPQAVCFHFRGSAPHNVRFRQYLSFRNRYFLIAKNATWKNTGGLFLSLFAYDLPRLVLLLVKNPYTVKALGEVGRYSGELLRKRLGRIGKKNHMANNIHMRAL